jgi:hypothetical protein
MKLIDTAQALLDDPRNALKPEHSLNVVHLMEKGLITKSRTIEVDELKEFIDNNGLTRSEKLELDRHDREKETLAIAKKSAYYSKLALIISILALFCAVIPLFHNQ